MPAVARRSLLLVAACGALALASLATAASTDPNLQFSDADMAWAGSMLLTPDDLGAGWRVDPSGEASGDASSGADDCSAAPDESGLTLTGVSSSPGFRRADQSFVASAAVVWQTADQAQTDWDRGTALVPGFLACIGDELKAASTKKVRITVGSVGAIEFPSVAPRTAAFRLKLVFTRTVRVKKKLRKVSFAANTDLIFLGNGRAFASIAAFWFSKKPLTQAYETALASKLAARMSKDPAEAATH